MPNKDTKNNQSKEKAKILLLFFYRYFYFFSLLLVVVVITIGFFVFVIPKYKTISEDMKARDEEKRLELDYLNKYQLELTKYNASYTKLGKEEIEKVNKIYPELKDIEELFTELSVLVKKNGLLLNSIELKKHEEKKAQKTATKKEDDAEKKEGEIPELSDDTGVIEIDLEISGVNYKSLKNILRTFENNLRIFDIKNLSFESGNSLSLEIQTYYDKTNIR